jgi:hypothetical protein
MRNVLLSTLVLAAIILSSAALISQPFSALFVLEGTWVMETRKGKLFEQWKKVSENELQGKSYKLNKSDTVLLERVRLHETRNEIFYEPVVQDQNNRQPVSFKLISSEKSKYIFENKLHDFPQRIIYHVITTDSIVARIEGSKNGQSSGSDYYFRRVK